MKRFFYVLLSLGFTLSIGAAQIADDWPNPFEMDFDPIEFTAAEPVRAELSNGIIVYLLEDDTLPLVQGVAYIDAPGIFDPVDKVGLASMTASLLREGGAGGRSATEIDEQLEFLAASVEASAGDVLASVSFNALAENVDEVLPIWRDVIRQPDFDEGRLEVARGRTLESIRRENDNPVQIAVREFYFRVAEGHPSGYFATEDTINAISRQDLMNFHNTYYQPSATAIAVTGAFNTDEMLAKLEATLGDWENQEVNYPDIPAFNPDPEPKIYHAQKEFAQSIIIVGHPTAKAYSPEYNDFDVANQILGNGFSSRLFTEIRTKRGLAYSTGTGLQQGFEYPSILLAFGITNGETTGEVLGLILSEIERLQADGVTDAELEQRRETILNRSLFRFTSPSAITERTARVGLLGLEPGYYERYLENVQSISTEDVQAIAQSAYRPTEAVIMVVGDEALFDVPLSTFGDVVPIDLE